MKINIENKYKKIQIEVPGSDLTIDEVIESLIVPALLGMEYQEGSIREYIPSWYGISRR